MQRLNGIEGTYMGMSKSTRQAHGRRAFTLVELLVVLCVLVTVAGLVGPQLTEFIPAYRLDREMSTFVAVARRTKVEAVTKGLRHKLTLNFDENSYRVTVESDPLNAYGTFTDTEKDWGRKRSLPASCEFRSAVVSASGSTISSGETSLTFFASGKADGATIEAADDRGNASKVSIDAITGKATLQPREANK
jgi:prepilin-type N-terminal cleavage/methylation domain-containing protein